MSCIDFTLLFLFVKYLPKARELLTRSGICGRNTVFVRPLIECYWWVLCCRIFFKILLWPWLQSHFQMYVCCCFCCCSLYSAAKIPFQKHLILFNLFRRILTPSFQLLHNLDKTWSHNTNFKPQVLHSAPNSIKETTSCVGFANTTG